MRKLLYKALRNSTDLGAIVDRRILEASAIGSELWPGVPERPFMTYRMHTHFPVIGGAGRREYAQVWANDDPGDYETIDDMLRLAQLAVEAIPSQGDFIEARWVETGVDLKDDAMGTINRYIRFQLTGTHRERN
jgi:hypothetical protein